MGDRDRPAKNPGGMECMACGEIFIGEEWHSLCRKCQDDYDSHQMDHPDAGGKSYLPRNR